MRKLVRFTGGILICVLLFSGCDQENMPMDPDTVLDWNTTSIPEEPLQEKLPVLQVRSMGSPTEPLNRAVERFIDIAKFTEAVESPEPRIVAGDSFYATWTEKTFLIGNEGSASYDVMENEHGDCISFGLYFRTFENDCIRQTFILPDKETIPSHAYTSDRFQQGIDLDFLSCEDVKAKTREFLGSLGLPVDNLEFTIYTIDLETLQTVADDMYAAGRFEVIPASTTPSGGVKESNTMLYKQYAKEDECYYIIVRFTYNGIPLYDDEVGFSNGAGNCTWDFDSENSPFTMVGPGCQLLLEQDGFTYSRIATSTCLNFEAMGKPKPVLSFQEAREALASLYAGKVIVKPDSVQKLELCYIPVYHEESKSFTLVPAWHAELYTYPYPDDPDHIRVEQVFLDAYDGHQLYPPEEVSADAAS